MINDASAASKDKNYAQERILVVLMADKLFIDDKHYNEQVASWMGGKTPQDKSQ